MEPWHVVAALTSAMLHAGWNAAVKASADPPAVMTAQMVIAALLVVPGLIWTGLPPVAALPWMAASTTLSIVTVTALLKAYELAGFGISYPISRAISVALVAPLAVATSGEALSGFGMAGIACMAVALILLALGNRGADAIPRKAFAWIGFAGLTTATYVLCDAQGVRIAGSPWVYGFAVAVANAVAMLVRQRSSGIRMSSLVSHWRPALPIACASVASYQLILAVWASAPVAPASALRDTSAVFALLIATLWLREPFTRLKAVVVLLAAAAIPLLRLA